MKRWFEEHIDLVYTIILFAVLWVCVLYPKYAGADDHADFWYYTSQGMIVADWATTRDCANYDWCYEANPFVAPLINNSDGTINKTRLDILTAVVLVANHYAQDRIPHRYRAKFNMAHTLIRFMVVNHNVRLGLEIGF